MRETDFRPLPTARLERAGAVPVGRMPLVYRGLAAGWPAVTTWSFARLAAQLPESAVELVVGNREREATRFVSSKLRHYVASLGEAGRGVSADAAYLKEFDLLKAVPSLRTDLRHRHLIASRSLRSIRSWMGPAGVRTGLHCDRLDNLAVQVIGRKRWLLVRPGTVERLGAVSSKYDAWARLASEGAHALAERCGSTDDFFIVDLEPGDVLQLPAGWWHEVSNLTAGVLLAAFHGPPVQVLARWAWVSSRDRLHRAGWLAPGDCTCHRGSRPKDGEASMAAEG